MEELREQAARGEIILGYVDETGFSSTPDNRYAWTKIGDVHAVDAIRLKRVNVMGCLLSTGKLVTSCLQESVKSTWFYAYLTGIAQQVKQMYNLPLVLIADNASIHRSKKMADYRELLKTNFSTNLYFIPAYSPELNRIEMVWKQMKYYWRDFQVMTADKIEQWVEKVSNQFGKEYMFTF
ncbi:IS630 family transposase [Acinetobacter lwoffii]|uniref:IS630 family transposase n=1 Tax=Acinetobacter TaxID=469 RepID=UPI00208FA709|nr:MULTISPECIES: IS630 family transposase [Acinetobacter]